MERDVPFRSEGSHSSRWIIWCWLHQACRCHHRWRCYGSRLPWSSWHRWHHHHTWLSLSTHSI